ncbi:hypothetical protein [Tateyamaria pelophila]|uniref:hypothetical protein n=1 Tax=Tateyamaria pelophila TaxID=328415 RepID=UPI001CBC03A8|nr:hypothetical protein [Tateyamaria pelophila]
MALKEAAPFTRRHRWRSVELEAGIVQDMCSAQCGQQGIAQQHDVALGLSKRARAWLDENRAIATPGMVFVTMPEWMGPVADFNAERCDQRLEARKRLSWKIRMVPRRRAMSFARPR